jgi:hypothetical protein
MLGLTTTNTHVHGVKVLPALDFWDPLGFSGAIFFFLFLFINEEYDM